MHEGGKERGVTIEGTWEVGATDRHSLPHQPTNPLALSWTDGRQTDGWMDDRGSRLVGLMGWVQTDTASSSD